MHAPLGATTHAPPVNRMTNWCKNITLPQTSFATGNKAATNLDEESALTVLECRRDHCCAECIEYSEILGRPDQLENHVRTSIRPLVSTESQSSLKKIRKYIPNLNIHEEYYL